MDFIVYHNNCPDGWCAAFISKMKYPEATLLPLNHGLNEEQLDDLFRTVFEKDVLMVDYSLRTRELNDQMANITKSFRILDHHKTAQAVLAGASYATFDMKRSGAGLAFDYLWGADSDYHKQVNPYNPAGLDNMPPLPRPWWVNYTEDQDLWNWALPGSQEVNAFLMVQPRTVETWKEIIKTDLGSATVGGRGVRQYIEYYTRSVIAEAQDGVYVFKGNNYRTAVLNIPYAGVSEAGAALVRDGSFDISLMWYERGDGVVQFSLRSNKDGSNIDVSEIASSQGGGGHRNAAGFQLSLAAGRKLVDWVLGRDNYVPSRCC